MVFVNYFLFFRKLDTALIFAFSIIVIKYFIFPVRVPASNKKNKIHSKSVKLYGLGRIIASLQMDSQ